jgi:hypothetical protein
MSRPFLLSLLDLTLMVSLIGASLIHREHQKAKPDPCYATHFRIAHQAGFVANRRSDDAIVPYEYRNTAAVGWRAKKRIKTDVGGSSCNGSKMVHPLTDVCQSLIGGMDLRTVVKISGVLFNRLPANPDMPFSESSRSFLSMRS